MRRATFTPCPGSRALYSVTPTLATVDWEALFEAFAGSLVAGVGITLAFAIGVRGLIAASQLRADERQLAASLATVVGGAGVLVAIAATIVGFLIVAGGDPLG